MKKIYIILFLIAIAIQVFGSEGTFTNANWFALDGCGEDVNGRIGLSNTVFSVLVNGNDVYAAGDFIGTTGDVPENDAPLNRIARWDGTKWHKFNDAVTTFSRVNCLALHNNNLYAGGYITRMDTSVANMHRGIARWSFAEQNWYPLDKNDDIPDSNGVLFTKTINGYVNKILPVGDTLYIGGWFGGPGNSPLKDPSTHFIAYNTITDSFVLLNGLRNSVNDIIQHGDDLYIAGDFYSTQTSSYSGFPANYIVRYNIPTNTYHHLTDTSVQALNDRINSLAIHGDYLYAGGLFTNISLMGPSGYISGGDSVARIAKYNLNTNTWSPLSSDFRGVDNWVYAMKIHDDNLYIAGAFQNIVDSNGVAVASAARIVRYNLTDGTWTTFGDGLNNTGISIDITADGTKLYVGGHFSLAGDKKANYIAGLSLIPNYFAGGDGSIGDPFQITTWEDLNNVRKFLGDTYTNTHFILMNNLDSTTLGYDTYASANADGGNGWLPIGSGTGADAFHAIFDGDSFTIGEFYINRLATNNVGLFGYVENSIIKNVGVIDFNCTGNSSVGGLVGTNKNGTILNCYSVGNVRSNNTYVGGLVGENRDNGVIINSYASVKVTGNSGAGGLVGLNWNALITNSYAAGNVNGTEHVGGLIGDKWGGTTSNSYAKANVNGNTNIGGLIGNNNGTIINTYAVGKINGSSDIGGIVGTLGGTGFVHNSFYDIYTTGRPTSDIGVGLATINMVDSGVFSDSTWNFSDTWTILQNQSYPFLKWQISDTPFATAYSIVSSANNTDFGSVIISADTQFAGGTVTVTSIANAGFEFDSWTLTPDSGIIADTSSAITEYTFEDTNVTITANFKYTHTKVVLEIFKIFQLNMHKN